VSSRPATPKTTPPESAHHPNSTIAPSAGNDVLGVGRAIEEAGLVGKVCLVGTGLPNPSAAYLDSGAITAIGFWDPQKAGIAMNEVARILLDGGELTDGMDLGVEGYNSVSVSSGAGDGKLVVGNGMVIVDKDTYQERLF
jgi:simple sugar transport system substrate-binding protein